jgi:PqqD family protein of HPr-rel-A system
MDMEEGLVGLLQKRLPDLPFLCLTDHCCPLSSIEDHIKKGFYRPSGAWLEVTNRCNLRCIHCYAGAGKPLDHELSYRELIHTVDSLVSLGFEHFTICGGEPLVYEELIPLLKHLIKINAKAHILTNATLLSRELADFFVKHNINMVITLFSHIPEHHDKISSIKGSWEKTMKGIRQAIKSGNIFDINIPIGAYNQDDLEETLNFLENMGVPREKAGGNIVYPLGRGCDTSVLPDKKIVSNIKNIHYCLEISAEKKLFYHTCWCGKLLIKANGDVTPCPSARDSKFIIGNVRRQSMEDIIHHPQLLKFWNITFDQIFSCQSCEFKYGCLDCRANAYNYHGSLTAKNPYCLYDQHKGEWIKQKEAISQEDFEGLWIRGNDFELWRHNKRVILFHKLNGSIHHLNQTATEIFDFFEKERNIDSLIRRLMERYEVDKVRIESDIAKLLSQFKEAGIVKRI